MWGQHGVCLLSLPTPSLCSDQILARVKLKIRGAKAKTSDCMSAVTNPISRREGRLTGHSHVTSSLDFLKKVLEVTLDPVSDRSPLTPGTVHLCNDFCPPENLHHLHLRRPLSPLPWASWPAR